MYCCQTTVMCDKLNWNVKWVITTPCFPITLFGRILLACGIRLFHCLAAESPVWMGERFEEGLISMSGSIWHGSCWSSVRRPAWTETTWNERNARKKERIPLKKTSQHQQKTSAFGKEHKGNTHCLNYNFEEHSKHVSENRLRWLRP